MVSRTIKAIILTPLLAGLLVSTGPVRAQEPVPGDSCAGYPQGAFMRSGGPELGGKVYSLTCSNGIWNEQRNCPGSGLVGHWKLDESSGSPTAADSAGANTGTLTNMDPATDWITGKIGNALDFDGADDYVNLGNFHPVGAGDISISGWFTASNADTDKTIIADRNTGAGVPGFYAAVCKSTAGACQPGLKGKLYFEIDDGTDYGAAYWSGAAVDDGSWHHFVASWARGQEPKIYIDGIENSTINNSFADVAGAVSPATNLTMGQRPNNQQRFQGKIDDLRIYNRALGAEDVSQLYNGGAGCL